MLDEKVVGSLIKLLSEEEVSNLQNDLKGTFGEDYSAKIDGDLKLKAQIEIMIINMVKKEHPEQYQVIMKEHGVVYDQPQTKAQLIKIFSGSQPEEQSADAHQIEADKIQVVVEDEPKANYNMLLDGRFKIIKNFDYFMDSFDEENKDILIKIFLYLSLFIFVVSIVLAYGNASNINDIKALYSDGNLNFLYSYAEICKVDVAFAKGNECVLSEVNKKITTLSNSKFLNVFCIIFFFILILFLFIYKYTYRESKVKV